MIRDGFVSNSSSSSYSIPSEEKILCIRVEPEDKLTINRIYRVKRTEYSDDTINGYEIINDDGELDVYSDEQFTVLSLREYRKLKLEKLDEQIKESE